jgi:hypothetical protein
MKAKKNPIYRRIIHGECLGFAAVIALIWFNEIMDLPHLLFKTPATPINWSESLFESIGVCLLALVVTRTTAIMLRRIKVLEGYLPICASCKRIETQKGQWQPIEKVITDRSEADLTHGICPECAEKLYPEFNPYKTKRAPDDHV